MMFNPGCACCQKPIGGCCGCVSSPNQWDVTIAGVSGDCGLGANSCNPINGTHRITRTIIAGICRWAIVNTLGGCYAGGTDLIQLRCDPAYYPDYWLVGIGNVTLSGATYFAPVATWNCNGVNIATFDSSFGSCSWPATVTLAPVP